MGKRRKTGQIPDGKGQEQTGRSAVQQSVADLDEERRADGTADTWAKKETEDTISGASWTRKGENSERRKENTRPISWMWRDLSLRVVRSPDTAAMDAISMFSTSRGLYVFLFSSDDLASGELLEPAGEQPDPLDNISVTSKQETGGEGGG